MTKVLKVDDVSQRFDYKRSRSIRDRFTRRESIGDSFWALKNITFDLEAGESLSLLGANGSGKSTLLKVIGGIYRPTSGRVMRQGRLGALLELGAGFHPELTGRENIYLNGAMLGLSNREMSALEADIIDFSGISAFIDSPVKTYSSGMYVRLGFAVAVHTEPDILLVDEVLAVGDESFQAQCLQKIRSLQTRGTSIVLVTHSMPTAIDFTQKSVLLHKGEMLFHGATDQSAQIYHQVQMGSEIDGIQAQLESIPDIELRSGVAEIQVKDFEFLLDQTKTPNQLKVNEASNNKWIWATPEFDSGSGGHHDIFMLAEESMSRNISNVIGLVNGDFTVDITRAKKIAAESYEYRNLDIRALSLFESQQNDLVIGTGWQTFAHAMRIPAKNYAYLVQDYESLFYPPSIQSVLAESTYKKNVPCLTAGPWLAKTLSEKFGNETFHFELGYNPEYYSENKFNEDRDAIVIYFRPGTPRRASELMVEVLRVASPGLSEFTIHFVGGSPRGKLPYRSVSHGRLTHGELGELYGRAAVTCVISLTNTSLVPVEALACGSNLLTNNSDSNLINLKTTNAQFFDLDIPAMASGLIELCKNTSRNIQASNRDSVLGREWDLQKKNAVDYLENVSNR